MFDTEQYSLAQDMDASETCSCGGQLVWLQTEELVCQRCDITPAHWEMWEGVEFDSHPFDFGVAVSRYQANPPTVDRVAEWFRDVPDHLQPDPEVKRRMCLPGDERTVSVAEPGKVRRWLVDTLGRGSLRDLYRFHGQWVHGDKVLSKEQFRALVNDNFEFVQEYESNGAAHWRDLLVPADVAHDVFHAHYFPQVPNVSRVVNTPTFRADGSILQVPGYDPVSGMYFQASTAGRRVDPNPAWEDVHDAWCVLQMIYSEFPFETDDDRVNFVGAMFMPMLREVVGGTQKMVLINAPQRGSGKTLLAKILMAIYGGEIHSKHPRDSDELRKQITASLRNPSGSVVVWDNATDVGSPDLDALLTAETWTDRILGKSETVTVANDRLWVATGNNLQISGDLGRRVIWVNINPKMERPEDREFDIDLESWIADNLGEVRWALATIVADWIARGRPTGDGPSDSFGATTRALRGLLPSGEPLGVFDNPANRPSDADSGASEWGRFHEALAEHFGTGEPFSTRQVADALSKNLDPEFLPAELALLWDQHGTFNQPGFTRSLGQFFKRRNGRIDGGRSVEQVGKDRRGFILWRVVDHN